MMQRIDNKSLPYQPGDVVDGKYKILSVLGQGGMGTVYKATHIHLGVDRVIKIMRGVDDERTQQRFAREARLAARIHFPNVASLIDFGVNEQGFFTVWEYVPGVTLAAVLRTVGRVHWRVMVVVGGELLRAMKAVHEAGILHRDIAPSNIMLYVSEQDVLETKLIDFGIAKQVLAQTRDRELTGEGLFVGTPRYAAPEQIATGDTHVRSDLYSAAVVMYQMLIGTVPFQSDTTIGEVVKKLNNPVVNLPDELWQTTNDPLPRELEKVIVRGLSLRRVSQRASTFSIRLPRQCGSIRSSSHARDRSFADVFVPELRLRFDERCNRPRCLVVDTACLAS